ncbi:hypothetical protein HPB50_006185 [Hyalomma asiaticum]|uniref:Uncharacterized protein n=1 Tax=Hyalomma asiaticum TaxID=266040 RepID=A0ACB7SLC1_HYAAI|nr:hypothetical protein HPB50_006185 [Hyalomma asiaticum]
MKFAHVQTPSSMFRWSKAVIGLLCSRTKLQQHLSKQQDRRTIPRRDKQLTSSCVVCDIHFQDSDLVKQFVHTIYDDVLIILREKWALKDYALPRLFPNCPAYL